MRVLLVVSESATKTMITSVLLSANIEVDSAYYGDIALNKARVCLYDVIMLELMQSHISGLEVLRRWRQAGVTKPIVIVSHTDNIESKVQAFGLGADDYISKPVDQQVLPAQLRAVVRRCQSPVPLIIKTGQISLHIHQRTVEVGGKKLSLGEKEYGVLELLSMRKGVILSKKKFLDHLYPNRTPPNCGIVDDYISKLRKKIAVATGGENYIETIWGHGYTLCDPADYIQAAE